MQEKVCQMHLNVCGKNFCFLGMFLQKAMCDLNFVVKVVGWHLLSTSFYIFADCTFSTWVESSFIRINASKDASVFLEIYSSLCWWIKSSLSEKKVMVVFWFYLGHLQLGRVLCVLIRKLFFLTYFPFDDCTFAAIQHFVFKSLQCSNFVLAVDIYLKAWELWLLSSMSI